MIEEKRRSRRLTGRGIKGPQTSPATLTDSTAKAKPDRLRRPKLKLKMPPAAPTGDA